MGRAQRKSTVHELRTAHSAHRRKKQGGHTNPYVRTIIYNTSVDAGASLGASLRELAAM